MRLLITGICGFVGSAVAETLLERRPGLSIAGIDNLMRPGSEGNRLRLRRMGVEVFHGDLRKASDLEPLPAADWVLEAAAQPSVLAGVQGGFSSRGCSSITWSVWGMCWSSARIRGRAWCC